MNTFWYISVLITFYFFFLNYVTTLKNYANAPKNPAEVYGYATDFGEAAYFVSVKEKLLVPQEDREYDNYCSGSIIKQDLVVSAAHCYVDRYTEIDLNIQDLRNRIIDRSNVRDSYVVAGQLRSSSERMEDYGAFDAQWRPIKGVIVPRNYNYPANDLALVRLKKEFNFNSNVQPISYAKISRDYTGLKCFVTGFGKISDLYKDFAPILMKSYVEVLNNSNCKVLIQFMEENTMLCSTSDHALALEGDSGGPLICKKTKDPKEKSRGVLVGVISSYTSTNITIYTRLSAFYDFIHIHKDKANENSLGEVRIIGALFVILFVLK